VIEEIDKQFQFQQISIAYPTVLRDEMKQRTSSLEITESRLIESRLRELRQLYSYQVNTVLWTYSVTTIQKIANHPGRMPRDTKNHTISLY
jgi:hypothetical protein